jgi:hypothetical protein
MPRTKIALLLLLALTASTAALANSYRVEMVVFKRFDAAGGETWPQDAGEPDMGLAVARLPGQELSSGQGRLGPIAYTLERQGYRVLLHAAWIQPVGGRSSTRWYSLSGRGLRGLVRVTRGRYLHFETDLLVDAGAEGAVRTSQSRRMRSAEVHYIDHPRVGIVVRIDPYTPAQSSESEEVEPGMQ